MRWSKTKPPANGLKKPQEDPGARSSGAFRCPGPVKLQRPALGQHFNMDPSSDASSHHSGAAESTVLTQGLQHLPTPSLLSCPPSRAEVSDWCLPVNAFPKVCTGLARGRTWCHLSITHLLCLLLHRHQDNQLRMLKKGADTSWGHKFLEAKPATRS